MRPILSTTSLGHSCSCVLVITYARQVLRTFTDRVGSGHQLNYPQVRSGHGSKVQIWFNLWREPLQTNSAFIFLFLNNGRPSSWVLKNQNFKCHWCSERVCAYAAKLRCDILNYCGEKAIFLKWRPAAIFHVLRLLWTTHEAWCKMCKI